MLTKVLTDNVDANSWMHGLLDARRVGAIGHSMGAWTVLGLVANQCCRDPRVKAAIILAGEMAPAFTTRYAARAPPAAATSTIRTEFDDRPALSDRRPYPD